MTLIICPGVHSSELTEQFLENLDLRETKDCLVFPSGQYPPYSPTTVLTFLEKCAKSNRNLNDLLFISFSAGVVGAIGAALTWQAKLGRVKAFIALDGWGVPLVGNFPIYRVSHDYFTHVTSIHLGGGWESFYVDPGVSHLDLWKNPLGADGWCIKALGCRYRCSAAKFIAILLQKYGESDTILD